MTTQLAIRIPDDDARRLRALVRQGRFPTRTDAVRQAIADLLDREERGRVDEAIVAGYRRHPPQAGEDAWADASGREMIAEEPW